MTARPPVAIVTSPVVGAATGEPLAEALRAHDLVAVAVEPRDDDDAPYSSAHAASVAEALLDLPAPPVLLGHSGAGPLLPLVAERLGQVTGYLFCDAWIPQAGASRLDLLDRGLPAEVVGALREHLAAGGTDPAWDDGALADLVPDPEQRGAVLASLRPRGEAFNTEPIRVPDRWPERPCAFLRLSAAYEGPAADAEARGWSVVRRDGGHFDLLTEPEVIADVVVALLPSFPPPVEGVAVDALAYDSRGLIPAVVQQHDSGEVLMMAWMTADTLRETVQRGETVFHSRSRGQAWHKGASSGNVQRVVEVVADCDGDTLLIRVDQRGPHDTPQGVACHTGARSCFHRPLRADRSDA